MSGFGKRILRGLVLVGVLGVMAACGNGAADGGSDGNSLVLDVNESEAGIESEKGDETGIESEVVSEIEGDGSEVLGVEGGLPVEEGESGGQLESSYGGALDGKLVTILGDSISTYTGYIPEDYSKFYPEYGDLNGVEDTWWMQVIERTGMEFCANASYSGGTVSGDSREQTDGRAACSDRRMKDLKGADGENPEIILAFTGANELLTNIPLGSYDGTAVVAEGKIENFSEAYGLMLAKIQAAYPEAQIYCFTILEVSMEDENGSRLPFKNELGLSAKDYNQVIRQIAKARELPVIDMYECGITVENYKDYTIDGVHPNREGAKKMGDYVSGYFTK